MKAVESTPAVGRWRHIRKWLIRTGFLILVILGLAAAGVFWHWARSNSDLERAIAETNALDPGWRDANVTPPQVPTDEKTRALRALWDRAPWQNSYFGTAYYALPPQIRLSKTFRAALAEDLKSTADALPEMRRQAATPNQRLAASLGPYLSGPIHERVLRLLQADCLALIESGNFPTALESWGAFWNVTSAIGNQPAMTSQIACTGNQTIAILLVERLLAQTILDHATLAELQARLMDEDRSSWIIGAVRCERAETFESFEQIRASNASSLKQVAHNIKLIVWHQWPISDALANMPGSFPLQQATALRWSNRLVEIARNQPEDWLTQTAALSAEIRRGPSLAAERVINTANSFHVFQRKLARQRCAICAIAAERYRLANGDWPGSLDVLVNSQLLAAVPLDPFDARPLRYRRTGDGVVIYSIGMDASDSGGFLDRANPYRPGTDDGFQLWNVAQRRQPHPPEKKPADQP